MLSHFGFGKFIFSSILLLHGLNCLVSAAPTSCTVNGHQYNVDQIITKDVSVISGGSSGTYSAIRLRDCGKRVAVIEQTERLGGHTQTYIDPATGVSIDYGVIVFHHFDVVKNYFARLNVSFITSSTAPGVSNANVDFLIGKIVLSPIQDPTAALGVWAEQIAKYPYLDYGFDLPHPVPEDLLLPFIDFARKYNLGAMMPLTWIFTQGAGDFRRTPAIYFLKSFGQDDLADLKTGFLTTARHDNSLLYLSAQAVLGSDVFYNSTIIDVERSDRHGVSIIVKQGTKLTLIKSSQLIVAIPPTLHNLAPFKLADSERDLFRKFKYAQYFTGILKNTGIPNDTSLQAVDPSLEFSIPAPPSFYDIEQTSLPGYQIAHYLATDPSTTDSEIQSTILSQIRNIQFPGQGNSTPEFVVSSNHQPFMLQVDADDIRKGFYRKLYGLQGKRRTWWVGASWHTHDSSLIWRFVEGLLPNVTSALGA